MDIYLVGGAVRNQLLGLPVEERDWVVVGATPATLLAQGYRQVGRDFPVFLHPETAEEYALARTERKNGRGHHGFVVHAGPDVSLEDDLIRRDLTINAMAQAADGTLIDPWGGAEDLRARRLRHVSDAFAEDPLRVFRVARFAARLAPLGFSVAPETLALMRAMSAAEELAHLSAERVWRELHKALATPAPAVFFQVLAAADALAHWMPELPAVIPALAAHWALLPEPLSMPLPRYGALGWLLSAADLQALSERLKAPNDYRELGMQLATYGRQLCAWQQLSAEALLQALEQTGALRRSDWCAQVLRLAGACGQVDLQPLLALPPLLQAVPSAPLQAQGLAGKALGDALRAQRLALVGAHQQAASTGGAQTDA